MSIDYNLIAKLKAQNVQPNFVKVGDATVALLVPQFDSVTKESLPAIIQQTNLKEIDDHIAQVTETLANVQAVRDAAQQALLKT